MEALDYWRLCDELTAIQAALLVTGCDPSSDAEYIEKRAPERRPPGYQAAKTAISNALCRKAIPGRIVPLYADESAVSGKSPKQGLARWLREQAVHAAIPDHVESLRMSPSYLGRE
jgi:hypothetical protein